MAADITIIFSAAFETIGPRSSIPASTDPCAICCLWVISWTVAVGGGCHDFGSIVCAVMGVGPRAGTVVN